MHGRFSFSGQRISDYHWLAFNPSFCLFFGFFFHNYQNWHLNPCVDYLCIRWVFLNVKHVFLAAFFPSVFVVLMISSSINNVRKIKSNFDDYELITYLKQTFFVLDYYRGWSIPSISILETFVIGVIAGGWSMPIIILETSVIAFFLQRRRSMFIRIFKASVITVFAGEC